MSAKRLLPLIIATTLCGCSSIEGLYAPACVAYEGYEIELSGDRFTWRHFTDERKLDEHGVPVETASDTSKTGHYNYEDPQVFLVPDGGQSVISFTLQDEPQGKYLLTSAENRHYQRDGSMPECALRRIE